jgi:hypothetical protein
LIQILAVFATLQQQGFVFSPQWKFLQRPLLSVMSTRAYQEGKEEGKYSSLSSSGEGKSNETDEEVVGENVLPALMEFISGRRFRDEVTKFAQSREHLFIAISSNSSEGKNGDTGVLELTHEHKDAFDDYQRILEDLFEDFAKEQRTSSRKIFQCCQDTGKFNSSSVTKVRSTHQALYD